MGKGKMPTLQSLHETRYTEQVAMKLARAWATAEKISIAIAADPNLAALDMGVVIEGLIALSARATGIARNSRRAREAAMEDFKWFAFVADQHDNAA